MLIYPFPTSGYQRFSKHSAEFAKWLLQTPCAVKIHNLQGEKKPTPLWSKIVKITNYGIKYASCQLKIFQKTNLKVKISKILMKFDPRITWAKPWSMSRCLFTQIKQLSLFFNENRKKSRQKAFLNEKFIQQSLCLRVRKKHV